MKDELKDMLKKAGGYQDDSELNLNGRQRNIMPLFLMIDTSGSMKVNDGIKIQQVKRAIDNIKVQLASHNEECDASVIKVSVLCFDDEPHWDGVMQDPSLIKPSLDLGVLTNMGLAFEELEKNLSSDGLIQKTDGVGYKRAVFLLLSDGRSTDNIDKGLKKLKTNGWFVKGTRIGIAMGEDADTAALVNFTGAKSNVLRISDNNLSCLEAVLENVAVVASTTNSRANDLETQMIFDRCFEESAMATADILTEAHRKYTSDRPDMKVGDKDDPFLPWVEKNK